jgi:hypothetical protein
MIFDPMKIESLVKYNKLYFHFLSLDGEKRDG